ncbi:MAG: outer membrane lipoprotein carrier protein LolA [Alphaproteobacteria bacterium]|nr:outer membrane lipoprotein carrier protein LolA [Alphaproteobacteria bacterium]
MLAVLALFIPAAAQAGAGSSTDAAAITKAEDYLRGLKTAKARFLQTAPDGQQLIGTFYLNRPGKLRFEYDAPVRDFVVADGFFIYFYDAKLGEQSNAPISQTLADFLLRPELKLSGDIKVTEVKRSGGLLTLNLVQSKDPGAGSLMLGFEEQPMRLKKWRVVDATGSVVEIELFQVEENVALKSSLFVYAKPNDGPRKYN